MGVYVGGVPLPKVDLTALLRETQELRNTADLIADSNERVQEGIARINNDNNIPPGERFFTE